MWSPAPTRIELKHEDQKELAQQKQRRARLLAHQQAQQQAQAQAAEAAAQAAAASSAGGAGASLRTPVVSAAAAREEAVRARIGYGRRV